MTRLTYTSINKLILSTRILQGNHGFKVFSEEKELTIVLKYKGSLLLISTDRLWFLSRVVNASKCKHVKATLFISLLPTTKPHYYV